MTSIALLGPTGCGKSTLIAQFATGDYTQDLDEAIVQMESDKTHNRAQVHLFATTDIDKAQQADAVIVMCEKGTPFSQFQQYEAQLVHLPCLFIESKYDLSKRSKLRAAHLPITRRYQFSSKSNYNYDKIMNWCVAIATS